MSIADLIVETASALQMDPIDLGTILSYETAGTFDPTKRGPTTQWGQHRGLIQFGEPQAREYGVDWNNPVESQLGPDGAVARYFKGNGWKPGMGMLDAYSIVNAGAPGRYNASDANNGGAPGSVRDKVEGQMAGHRQKAQQLLGGVLQPASSGTAPAARPDQQAGGLSFGESVPQMPANPGLASMFDPRMAGGPLAMGTPVGMPEERAVASRRDEQRDREEAERTRRTSLAELIRY